MSPDFRPAPRWSPHGLSRRRLLLDSALGFGALALSSLLSEAASAERPAPHGRTAPSTRTHHRAKARNVIFLYMDGGVS